MGLDLERMTLGRASVSRRTPNLRHRFPPYTRDPHVRPCFRHRPSHALRFRRPRHRGSHDDSSGCCDLCGRVWLAHLHGGARSATKAHRRARRALRRRSAGAGRARCARVGWLRCDRHRRGDDSHGGPDDHGPRLRRRHDGDRKPQPHRVERPQMPRRRRPRAAAASSGGDHRPLQGRKHFVRQTAGNRLDHHRRKRGQTPCAARARSDGRGGSRWRRQTSCGS